MCTEHQSIGNGGHKLSPQSSPWSSPESTVQILKYPIASIRAYAQCASTLTRAPYQKYEHIHQLFACMPHFVSTIVSFNISLKMILSMYIDFSKSLTCYVIELKIKQKLLISDYIIKPKGIFPGYHFFCL